MFEIIFFVAALLFLIKIMFATPNNPQERTYAEYWVIFIIAVIVLFVFLA